MLNYKLLELRGLEALVTSLPISSSLNFKGAPSVNTFYPGPDAVPGSKNTKLHQAIVCFVPTRVSNRSAFTKPSRYHGPNVVYTDPPG